MKFIKEPPTKAGTYWTCEVSLSGNNTVTMGTVSRCANGWLRIIGGAFAFDLEDIFWGDEITIPEVELE